MATEQVWVNSNYEYISYYILYIYHIIYTILHIWGGYKGGFGTRGRGGLGRGLRLGDPPDNDGAGSKFEF